jgi:xylulokinase
MLVRVTTMCATRLKPVEQLMALNTRWLARAVDRFLGRPVRSMTITGGGARSDSWCQIFADVLGIEIRRDAQPVAVNTRGAGWIGAVGTGLTSFAEISDLRRDDRIFQPLAENIATYNRLFEVRTNLHKQLAPIYERLNLPTPTS